MVRQRYSNPLAGSSVHLPRNSRTAGVLRRVAPRPTAKLETPRHRGVLSEAENCTEGFDFNALTIKADGGDRRAVRIVEIARKRKGAAQLPFIFFGQRIAGLRGIVGALVRHVE